MLLSNSVEIMVVVGTRPEIIKLAPVIRALETSTHLQPYVVHTDQHYDEELSGTFFESLDLPSPDDHLEMKSGHHHEQTASGIESLGDLVVERCPSAVVSQGDTNTVLAAAVATSKLPTMFCHVEAGIRSYDRDMPEELNRVLADAVADIAFAPTERAAANLANEETVQEVYVTGNTVVDACLKHVEFAREQSGVLDALGLEGGRHVVATIHRERNVTDHERLEEILSALDDVFRRVVLPAHPRTTAAIDEIGFEPSAALSVVEPLDYLHFLRLLDSSIVTVTDSGGVQEEASILEVPCLTVRPNTERPETISAGVNRLLEPSELRETLAGLIGSKSERESMRGAPTLYGDGTAGSEIVDILETKIADERDA